MKNFTIEPPKTTVTGFKVGEKMNPYSEIIVEDAILNLDTGERMDGRFYIDSLTPHNIPDSWYNIRVDIKQAKSIRVIK